MSVHSSDIGTSERHARLAAIFALVLVVVQLSGLAAQTLSQVLTAGTTISGCGCGCQCCDEPDRGDPALPSCCGAPAKSAGSGADLPTWTGACQCGGRDGDALVGRAFEPALLAAAVHPHPDRRLVRSPASSTCVPATRPHDLDDPVPRLQT